MLLAIIALQVLLAVLLVVVLVRHGATHNTAEIGSLRELLLKLDARSERTEAALREEVRSLRSENATNAAQMREESSSAARQLREEVTAAVQSLATRLTDTLNSFREDAHATSTSLRDSVAGQIDSLTRSTVDSHTKLRDAVSASLLAQTQQTADSLTQFRRDNAAVGQSLQETLTTRVETLRQTVEQRLDRINENNAVKLEEMRQTVDEKLHSTLEKRLTESFGLVTDQLGKVQNGLGEMKELATGVGDLKRVLTNVKMRGGFAEVQLGMQLEQMLAPEQFIANARVKLNSSEVVEYAIRLPNGENGELLLPIDAKFPKEDWERLEIAQEAADTEAIAAASRALENAVRSEARKISDKYVNPPVTTNFAIMYLPTEGLFAEVLRRPGLIDDLQTRYRVCVAGPTTLMALLTSLQMGFRTLAIQKKGTEVWQILAATKMEFEKFGGLMSKVEKQVSTVQNTLGDITRKTKTINRTLKSVDTLQFQSTASAPLLGFEEEDEIAAAAAAGAAE